MATSTAKSKPATTSRKATSKARKTTAKKPAAKPAGRTGKATRKVDWDAQVAQLKEQLEKAWAGSEHAAEALWHQTAVASLNWISSHPSRIEAFKKSVKGTRLQKPVNNALKAIRSEAKAAKPAARKSTAKKPVAKKTATRKPAARKSTSKKTA